MIVTRARYLKLRSRITTWLDSAEFRLNRLFPQDGFIKAIVVSMLVITCIAGAGLYINNGREIGNLAVSLMGEPEQQHRNQAEPVATKERSTEERTMAAEPLGWLQQGETTAAQKLLKVCGYAMTIASENPAPAYPVSETRKNCGEAKKALAKEDTPTCLNAVLDVVHVVHNNKLNIVTNDVLAAACNALERLQQQINNGTADNPVFPVFGSDYDGMDRFDAVVFSNANS